jgi:hypothetical protein
MIYSCNINFKTTEFNFRQTKCDLYVSNYLHEKQDDQVWEHGIVQLLIHGTLLMSEDHLHQ